MDERPRRTRQLISLLIETGPPWDGRWSWSWWFLPALVGPGSVPFALLMFVVQRQVLETMYRVTAPGAVLALAVGGAIVLARFAPVAAWLTVMATLGWMAAGAVAESGAPWPLSVPAIFALLVTLFGVARDRPAWASACAWLAYLLMGWGVSRQVPSETATQNLILVGLLSTVALVVGMSVRGARRSRRRLAAEEQLTAEERAARRMLEERTRIARELHDVVAHHMSVITVQASTAEYRLEGLPDAARGEFGAIGEQARTSLHELRRLLTVLRAEDDTALRLPQPGLDQLESLRESVARTGTPVRLTVSGSPANAPETVSLTGYRIVQEALSNVVRHAAGSETNVQVVIGDDLRIHVTNAVPAAASAAMTTGEGLGLAGMRERVSLLGGEMTAETTAEGGFTVRARIPFDRETDDDTGDHRR